MSVFKYFLVIGAGLACACAPMVASAQTRAYPTLRGPTNSSPLYNGRSVRRGQRDRSGSYTNGVPDGANTGGRRQSPTGGVPGDLDHS